MEENDIIQHHYQQQQLQIQEDRLHEEIMREREEEIKNINRGMHTVNEIYKDLAHLVSQQQYDIDNIETQMEDSRNNAEHGLQQVEKANEKYGQGTCHIM
jgi:t-SNARE complex subunit (syntaxin)